jgi:hypothetical protein
MIDICDSEAIFKLSKRRKIGKTAEQVVVKWSNARPGRQNANSRPGRQIPAYTGVM